MTVTLRYLQCQHVSQKIARQGGREGLDLLNAYLILNQRPGDRAFNNKYIFLISIDYLIIQAFKVLTAKSKI